jgi:hypothetical protein
MLIVLAINTLSRLSSTSCLLHVFPSENIAQHLLSLSPDSSAVVLLCIVLYVGPLQGRGCGDQQRRQIHC